MRGYCYISCYKVVLIVFFRLLCGLCYKKIFLTKKGVEELQEEQLDAKGIFDTEDLKNWELNAEEKSKFREGEQKVLDNIGKMPEKAPERDALDSRDIF